MLSQVLDVNLQIVFTKLNEWKLSVDFLALSGGMAYRSQTSEALPLYPFLDRSTAAGMPRHRYTFLPNFHLLEVCFNHTRIYNSFAGMPGIVLLSLIFREPKFMYVHFGQLSKPPYRVNFPLCFQELSSPKYGIPHTLSVLVGKSRARKGDSFLQIKCIRRHQA